MFKHVVTREDELRALLGSPSDRAVKKESAVVDEPSRRFIALSPFLLLATSNAAGQCDVSPKGDQVVFVNGNNRSSFSAPLAASASPPAELPGTSVDGKYFTPTGWSPDGSRLAGILQTGSGRPASILMTAR